MSVMPTELAWGFLAALLLGILLLALNPRDRAGVRNLLVILGLLFVAELLSILLGAREYPRAARLFGHAATVGLGAIIIRLATMLVFQHLLPRLKLDFARIVEDLVTTVLAAAWLLFWLHGVGLDLGSLLTTSAVITAVLAFSMQDTLGNVLGGVVLQLDDSLRIGDWVKIDDISGQVVDVRWRHTAIETRNRETVVIPNGWLVKNRFTVIGSRNDAQLRWRRWVWFNVDVNASPARVCSALEDSVRLSEVPNVLTEPAPSAVLMEIGFGYARYALRYWMSDPRPDDPTDSLVRQHALAALARNGLRLAVQREERLVIAEDERRHHNLHEVELQRRRKALADVELFNSLVESELEALAAALVPAPFVSGDIITRQGAVAHWLYMIVVGEADVWSETDGGRHHIATLLPGMVFGEMGMMTGEPRSATVTARTDVECFRLDKRAFETVLRARPDIAEQMSQVMSTRRGELDTRRGANGTPQQRVGQQDALLSRIRHFFGLDLG